MSQFQLFDAVKLRESLVLEDGKTAPVGTAGAIVEVFNDGEAYMVELFGRWVTAELGGDFVDSSADEPEAFMETIGVETVSPEQIHLVTPARETVGVRAELLALVEELSEEKLEEVLHFAEFLKSKETQAAKAS